MLYHHGRINDKRRNTNEEDDLLKFIKRLADKSFFCVFIYIAF